MTWTRSRPPKPLLIVSAVVLILFTLSFVTWSWNSGTSSLSEVLSSRWKSPGDVKAPWPPWTFLPYTFGYSMLLQTLEGYLQAGWKDVVIVDNRWASHLRSLSSAQGGLHFHSPQLFFYSRSSWDHYAFASREHLKKRYSVRDVVPVPAHLRFSQLQAFMDHLAIEAGLLAYFWGHTDILLLRNGRNPYEAAVECLASAKNDAGVVFFDYDRLCGVFTRSAMAAPWDPFMPQYGADCDRYRRLRLAGLTVEDCEYTIGAILHLKAALNTDDLAQLYNSSMTLEQQIAFVDEKTKDTEPYSWKSSSKYDSASEVDMKAADAEGVAGGAYWNHKWGRPLPCDKSEMYVLPKFDVPGSTTPTGSK